AEDVGRLPVRVVARAVLDVLPLAADGAVLQRHRVAAEGVLAVVVGDEAAASDPAAAFGRRDAIGGGTIRYTRAAVRWMRARFARGRLRASDPARLVRCAVPRGSASTARASAAGRAAAGPAGRGSSAAGRGGSAAGASVRIVS